MIFGKKFEYKGLEKWFAWYPVKLNKKNRYIEAKITAFEELPNLGQWVWLQYVYRRIELMSSITTYQILPDYDHPDFAPKPNDVLKGML